MILDSDLAKVLWENLPIVVAGLHDGLVRRASRPLEHLFGYEVQESLVGKSVDDLIPIVRRQAHKDQRKEYAADPRVRPMGTGQVLEGLKKDGTIILIQAALFPRAFDGDECVVAVVIDLTGLSAQPTENH